MVKRWSFAWSWTIGAVIALSLPSCGGFPWPIPIPTPPPAACVDCDALPAHTGLVGVQDPVADSYIVVLKPQPAGKIISAAGFAAKVKGAANVRAFSRALNGFAATISDLKDVARLLDDERVKFVQQNGRKSLPKSMRTAASAPWALDRINQRALPLDGKYDPAQDGSGAIVYVLDTGCPSKDLKGCRQDHPEFGSRLQYESKSTVVYQGVNDAHGHGTFVQAEAVGTKYGVAKNARVASCRFLDANGSGDDAGAVECIEWVLAQNPGAGVRKVMSNSWGGGGSPAVDEAICRARGAGVIVSNAAGNSSEDCCSGSPARVVQGFSVGASDRSDSFAYFSSYGPNVDVVAPGVDVESTTPSGGSTTMSGTSMSTPLVAGAAALYLQRHPQATPDEVVAGLIAESTPDKLKGLPSGTANRLLFVRPVGE